MNFELRAATEADIPILAAMNEQLILNEGRQTAISFEELQTRMASWLGGERQAVLVVYQDEVIGYLLYRVNQDEYFPYGNSIYVRQYFIQPKYRRRGIGQIAFERITSEYFPSDHAVMLDVLESNPEGKAFWLKIGFEVYHTTLRRGASQD